MSKMRSLASAPAPHSAKKSRSSNFTSELPSLEELDSAPRRLLKTICKEHSIPGASSFSKVDDLRDHVRSWLLDELGQAPPEPPEGKRTHPERSGTARHPDLRPPDVTSQDAVQGPAYNTLSRLRDILSDIGKECLTPSGASRLEAGKLILEGLLAGMDLCASQSKKTNDPLTANRPSVPSFSVIAKKYGQGWNKIPKDTLNDLKSAKTSARETALLALREINSRTAPSAASRLWEPRMDGYRQKQISRHCFKTQLDASLREKLNLQEATIAFCSERLDRGGFLIQLTDAAEALLTKLKDQDIQTATNGTWYRLPKPTGPSGNSIVVERISEGISVDEVVEDIAQNNSPVHGMAPGEAAQLIAGGERLRRRDSEGNWIASTCVRVFMDRKLSDAILSKGGVIINMSPRHCRRYERPQYRCLRCGDISPHKAHTCSKQPVCKFCRGGHMSTDCPTKLEKSSQNDKDPLRPADANWYEATIAEEERRRKPAPNRALEEVSSSKN